MSSRPHSKRGRSSRASFITTIAAVASAAALTTGCNNTVTYLGGEGDGGAGGGGSTSISSTGTGNPTCPAGLPPKGSPCATGQHCSYPISECPFEISANCINGAWAHATATIECNPPPPVCPKSKPQNGTTCAVHVNGNYNCGPYLSGSCPTKVTATCVAKTGKWSVAEISCNPPPPDYCYTLTTEAKCDSAWCEWQVPGCGAPALPKAGCHPRGYACDVDPWLCQNGAKCQKVVVDPCWQKDCLECAAPAFLCLP